MSSSSRLAVVSFPLLLATVAAPLAAQQQTLRASLRALTPVTAEWLTAPPGTPGAKASYPAGFTSHIDLSVVHGLNLAFFTLDLADEGTSWTLAAESGVLAGYNELVATHADLLLVLTAPVTTVLDLDVRVGHDGDQPSPYGFQVDVGNDGSFELTTDTTVCCGTVNRRVWSWNFADGALPLRLTGHNLTGASPQAFYLTVKATPWAAGTAPIGPDGGSIVDLTTLSSRYTTNYRLAALPPQLPGWTTTLRATGLGEWHAFVLSASDKVVPIVAPAPFTGSGLLLGQLDMLVLGATTSTTTVPSEWRLDVPPLPPGLELHLQHLSARLSAPWPFGLTDPIVLRT